MKNLGLFLSDIICDKNILVETANLIADEAINESFSAPLLVALAKRIKEAEKEHAEYDKKMKKHTKKKVADINHQKQKKHLHLFLVQYQEQIDILEKVKIFVV